MRKGSEPRRVTAQPIGAPIFTPVRASDNRSLKDQTGRKVSRAAAFVLGEGCFRKMPTCRD